MGGEIPASGGQGAKIKDGEAGWQSDGSYLTPEGESLRTEVAQLAYLRTVQDWMIRPLLKKRRWRCRVDVIGGFEKQYHIQPDPQITHVWLESEPVGGSRGKSQSKPWRRVIEQQGEAYLVRLDGRLKHQSRLPQQWWPPVRVSLSMFVM